MTGPNLRNSPVPDECRGWVEQLFRDLDAKVSRQAARRENQIMRHNGGIGDARNRGSPEIGSKADPAALFDAVISGNYAQALDLCQQTLAQPDIGARGIHTALMLPAIRMVGQAWADDSASFAQTSLGFCLLHRLLDRLSQDMASKGMSGGEGRLLAGQQRIMVAVAPGDSHSFGAMILTEELRLRGWFVTFYDHSQNDAVIQALARQSFDTLAISVSCDESLVGLADFVTTCRIANNNPQMEIMIGGAAIQAPFGQYGFLQADRVGLSIEDVVSVLSSREGALNRDKWN